MKNKILLTLLFLVVIGFGFNFFDDGDDFELLKNLEIYHNVMKQLRINYVEEIDSRQLITSSIDNMLKDLDPYTVYYPESKVESIRLLQQAQYVGVGITIDSFNNKIYITEIENNTSAHKKGLKIGDIIKKVNGIYAEGKNVEQLHEMLIGQPGTSLKLQIERNNKKIDFELKREVIQLNVVSLVRKIENLGYIKLENFSRTSASDFRKAFLKLKKQKIEGLIIDLRDNGGGLLDQAVKIINLFIPKNKVVVSSKGNSKNSNGTYLTKQKPLDKKIPIVVLVNGNSASASEIVAGTLQDYDRAVIIGEQTYGKGLVQKIFDVGYNSKLKVTISKYYIPSGRCIQAIDYSHGKDKINTSSEFYTSAGRVVYEGNGIMPDIEISSDTIPQIINDLINKHYIFNFCNYYYSTLDTSLIPKPAAVKFTKKQEFLNFLENNNYYQNTEYYQNLQEIKEKLKDNPNSLKQINLLSESVKNYFNDQIIKNFNIIDVLISKEIVKRKYFHIGKIKYNLKKDTEIQKSINILNNKFKYKEILSPK